MAEEEGKAAVLEKLREVDPETAASLHENNIGRVIRALELYELTGMPMSRHSAIYSATFSVESSTEVSRAAIYSLGW